MSATVYNKTFSLFMVVIFLLATVFSPGVALAADEAAFSKSYEYISNGDNQNAGTVTVRPDDTGTVCDAVYVTLTLPEGVEFSDTPESSDVDSGKLVQISATTGHFDSADSDYITVWVDGSNWKSTSSPLPEVKFDFTDIHGYTNNQLDIDNDFEGNLDVNVEVEGVAGSSISWSIDEDITIAKVSDDEVTVTAGDLKKVSTGNGKEVAKITVEESESGLIVNGTKVELQIDTDGVEFSSVKATGEHGIGLTGGTVSLSNDADGKQTIAEVTVNSESGPFPGAIEFDPILLDIDPDVAGDIEITVSSNDDDVLDEETVTVASVGAGDLTITVDEETGMEEHMRITSIDELWEITIETNKEFSEEDKIFISLPDNFEFYEKAVRNLPIGDFVECLGTFNDDQSLWLEIKASGEGEDEITLSNLFVAALPGAQYGDINVEIHGDIGPATVKAGFLKPAVMIEPEQTYVVAPGYGQPAGNITFRETDDDAVFDGMKLHMVLPNGVEFASTPTVTVNGEEIDDVKVGPGEYDDDVCQFTVDKSRSSKIDTLVVSDIKYDIESWFTAGNMINVSLGGNDPKLGDTFNKFYEYYLAFAQKGLEGPPTDPKYWDNFQFNNKADEKIIAVPNAIVVDGNQVKVSFAVGDEGVFVENGRTMVQVNLLGEALGLQKSWEADTKTAFFVKDGKVVAFPIGQNKVTVNKADVPVDHGAKIINGYTCVSLRGLEMAFGGQLSWDNETKAATFNFPK